MSQPKTAHRLVFDVDPSVLHLLDSAAAARQVSRARLIARLIETIARDNMFEAVLDDGSRPWPSEPGRRKPRRISESHRAHSSFGSIPTAFVPPRARRYEPTKGELRSQLTEAVLNTGGVRSSAPGEDPAPSSSRSESASS